MALSCNYPIIQGITLGTSGYQDFTISTDGRTIYSGRVYGKGNESTVDIDISSICREYLDPKYEQLNLGGALSVTVPDSVKTFVVSPGGSFTVMYDYNTDYVTDIPTGTNLNAYIGSDIDKRMMIGTSVLGASGITLTQAATTGAVGSTVTVGGHRFKVLEDCRSRFALYYVNKFGGLDYLLTSGKRYVESWNPQRTDAKLYDNRGDRMDFQQTRVYQEIDHQFRLNTYWIEDEFADRIDHLIYSPKVWIHDLDKNTVTSCLITDAGYNAKNQRQDNLISYRINVKESQKQLRF